MNTNAKTENKTETIDINAILGEIAKSNPNGSVSLDKIQKEAKGLSRAELIEAVRHNKVGGVLKVGRRGNSSEILFGDSSKKFLEARAKYIGNSSKKHSRARSQKVGEFGGYVLKLSLNGKELTSLPLEAKIEQIAA